MSPYTRLVSRLSARRLDRHDLAAALRRIARQEVAPTVLGLRLAAERPQVAEARPELERLAGRLDGPDPVDPRGVTLTRKLLSDGSGPLRWEHSDGDLRSLLGQALAALDPAAARTQMGVAR